MEGACIRRMIYFAYHMRFIDAQIAALGTVLKNCEHELKRRRQEAKEHGEQMKVGYFGCLSLKLS